MSTIECAKLCQERAEVKSVVLQSVSKSCEFSSLLTWLLKGCIMEIRPAIAAIMNASFSSSSVLNTSKVALVRPLLKKKLFDKECQT